MRKSPPPLGPPHAPRHIPTEGSQGGAGFDERDTPVTLAGPTRSHMYNLMRSRRGIGCWIENLLKKTLASFLDTLVYFLDTLACFLDTFICSLDRAGLTRSHMYNLMRS